MPVYVEVHDETKPAGNRARSLGDDDIREFKRAIRERLATDHNFKADETGDTQIGYHKQVTLIEAADIGVGATGLPILGAQTVSGKPELTFTDEDNNDIQLTKSGVINAYIVGEIRMYGGAAAPTGWLACAGTAVSRVTYAALFAVIGTAYGAGDTVTTFNLPSLVNKFARGSATPGTGAGSDTHTTPSHILTTDEIPAHNHNLGISVAVVGGALYSIGGAVAAPEIASANAGGGNGHTHDAADNIPVYESVMYIIKT